ncbi:MAG: hypothetical protein HY376_03555 [Candidatus Blackburnbacteria bacterium]|nr:hypothetical protein [Candidatus Blackburnbacteria bacterium]
MLYPDLLAVVKQVWTDYSPLPVGGAMSVWEWLEDRDVKGALAGTFKAYIASLWQTQPEQREILETLDTDLTACFYLDNPDLAAVKAVLAWVEGGS